MMNTLLGMALAGSAVFLVWCAIDRLLGSRLPARWHYRILKLSLFFMLVPVGKLISLLGTLRPAAAPAAAAPVLSPSPALPTVTPILPPTAAAPLPEAAAPAAVTLSMDMLRLLAAVWALGAAALLLRKAVSYVRFRRRVLASNRSVTSPEVLAVFQDCRAQLGVRTPVRVTENPLVQTSLTTGLLRPVIVLPAASLPPQTLRYLFLHELTHVRNRDLWVRSCSLLALCVHWYNPFMHLLNRKIKDVSEQSCDEAVAGPLSGGERYAYGSVLLNLASAVSYPGEWAASLSAKETLERRLIRVLHPKHLTRSQKFLSLALAGAIVICGTAAALAARAPLGQPEESPAPPVSSPTTLLWESDSGLEEAVWFAPEDIHDITSAELLWWDGTSYPLLDPAAPDILEALLGGASQVQSADSSFHSVLYLTRADGTVGKLQPAGYSCTVFLSDGVYYDFGGTGSTELYALFGVSAAELPQWSASDAIQQLTDSLTYCDGAFSFNIPNGPGAWSIHIAGRLDEGGGMSVHYLDGETWTPGSIYAFQTDSGAYTELTMDIALDGQEAAVDLLPYLQEPSAEPAKPETAEVLHPDALRGDTALILSRGGTLLPDDDPSSYVSYISADGSKVYSKQFTGKNGYRHEEYLLGNREALLANETRKNAQGAEERVDRWLSELVNGEYPKNKNGESYGIVGLADYVGYMPDLYSVLNPDTGVSGYVRWKDVPGANVKTPEEALAYMEWREANPGSYQLPMYDAKGDQIGYWEMGGSDDSVDTTGMTIDEAKEAVANAGASPYPDAVRGDTDLILSRGGTLLPDDHEFAFKILNGTPYKCFESKPCVGEKHGAIYFEYRVGNKELLDDYQLSLLDTLVNGEYPKNSKGSSYGFDALDDYVGYSPDLHRASGTKGEIGCTRCTSTFRI